MVKVSFQEVPRKLLDLLQAILVSVSPFVNTFFLAKCPPVFLHDDGSGYGHIRDNKGAGTDITTGTVT